MKLTVSQPVLADAMARGGGMAGKSSVSSILASVRLRTEGPNLLYVASTDGDRFAEMAIPADVVAGGSVTINAADLTALVSKFPKDGEVSIAIENGMIAVVQCGRSKNRRNCLPADAFPDWGDLGGEVRYDVQGGPFAAALTRVKGFVGAAHTNRDGVYIDAADGALNLSAFSGQTIAWARLDLPPDAEAAPALMMPLPAVDAFIRLFRSESSVTVHLSEGRVGFEAGTLKFASKVFPGSRPPYDIILAERTEVRLTLDRSEFDDAVARAALAVEEGMYSAIALIPREGEIELKAMNSKGGETREWVAAEITPGFRTCGLVLDNVRAALAGLTGETVEIEHAAETRYLFTSPGDDTFMAMIAPVRLNPTQAA